MATTAVFLIVSMLLLQSQAKFNLRIIKFECKASGKTLTKMRCYTRAYNRRSPVFNVESYAIRRTEHVKLTVEFFHKLNIDDNFRSIFLIENIEMCKMFEGDTASSFTQTFMKWMGSVLKDYVRICTAVGQVNFNNVSIAESSFLQLFPAGRYQSVFRYRDDFDANIMQINATFVLTK